MYSAMRSLASTTQYHSAHHRNIPVPHTAVSHPYHTVSHRITPYHAVSHRITHSGITPYHTVSHRITPYHTVSRRITPHCVVSHPCLASLALRKEGSFAGVRGRRVFRRHRMGRRKAFGLCYVPEGLSLSRHRTRVVAAPHSRKVFGAADRSAIFVWEPAFLSMLSTYNFVSAQLPRTN